MITWKPTIKTFSKKINIMLCFKWNIINIFTKVLVHLMIVIKQFEFLNQLIHHLQLFDQQLDYLKHFLILEQFLAKKKKTNDYYLFRIDIYIFLYGMS
jgi:hypothetical protein